MKKYRSHKIVQAGKIIRITGTDGGFTLDMGDDGTQFVSTAWAQARGLPEAAKPDGYFVLYPDGYTSYSPASAFEKGYTLLSTHTPEEDFQHFLSYSGLRGHPNEPEFRQAFEAGSNLPRPPIRMKLEPHVDLCATSLEEAARLVGSSFSYTLKVAPEAGRFARRLLHSIGAQVAENPFAPYVNLEVDSKLDPHSWELSANDKAVWSPGA